jgi:diguanylate cyclase (GGDEF)-like protein/PAS domain S-box-containing protein
MMVKLVWFHVGLVFLFGVVRDVGIPHALTEVVPIIAFAVIAGMERLTRAQRACAVALGLLTSSAMIVHLWDGRIEAHFHFFVMVSFLALYEEWSPYLLAIAYVVLHHALGGAMGGGAVFDHPAGMDHPWLWSAVHGGFISALAASNVVFWRLNEDVRDDMRDSESRFRSAFDDAPIGMALVDGDGTVRRVNGELVRTLGFESGELVGMPLSHVLSGDEHDDRPWPRPELAGVSEERRYVRRDGSTGWALFQHSLLEDDAGTSYITHVLDISARKQAENQLDHQAHHDPLTGLPNRKLFRERLDVAIANRPEHRTVGVLFVDLDNFKLINDSLGHASGDRLLIAIADRMRRVLRPGDTIARFGGDEFAVLVENVVEPVEVRRVADRLNAALRAPVVLDGEQRYVTASIGIRLGALAPADVDPGAIMRDADAAMYRAKELGKARCETFDDALRAQVDERIEFEGALRGAEERGELRLEYQPFIDLATGRVAGVEALLRWEHPMLGTVPPLRFIPVAESSGTIVPIGAWVLREACAQGSAWIASSPEAADFEIAVNVSPRQLASPTFADDVANALDLSGLGAHHLCLEVTESAVVADLDTATRSLERLKKLGVKLAIDDFGVGYASLSQLKALPPLDILKIDRSFVAGMLGDHEDRAIVEAVLQLAASLGLATVAEGIETAEQAVMLRDMRCSLAQGYHFARPTSAGAISELLSRQALGELAL